LARSVARDIDHREPVRTAPSPTDGQIVLVRPHVVDTVGHVLGNVFQRLYHLIERVRTVEVETAVQLESNARQLEDFLQLALDYFSPLSLALQHVAGTDVAQSLARQLSDMISHPVHIDATLPLDSRVLVDPGLLGRGFRLLAMQLRQDAAGGKGIELRATTRAPSRSLAFTIVIPPQFVAASAPASEMRWAVAEKFLEVHGGSIQQQSTSTGEVLWEIVLPLQS
jgi:hypothetical protein